MFVHAYFYDKDDISSPRTTKPNAVWTSTPKGLQEIDIPATLASRVNDVYFALPEDLQAKLDDGAGRLREQRQGGCHLHAQRELPKLDFPKRPKSPEVTRVSAGSRRDRRVQGLAAVLEQAAAAPRADGLDLRDDGQRDLLGSFRADVQSGGRVQAAQGRLAQKWGIRTDLGGDFGEQPVRAAARTEYADVVGVRGGAVRPGSRGRGGSCASSPRRIRPVRPGPVRRTRRAGSGSVRPRRGNARARGTRGGRPPRAPASRVPCPAARPARRRGPPRRPAARAAAGSGRGTFRRGRRDPQNGYSRRPGSASSRRMRGRRP